MQDLLLIAGDRAFRLAGAYYIAARDGARRKNPEAQVRLQLEAQSHRDNVGGCLEASRNLFGLRQRFARSINQRIITVLDPLFSFLVFAGCESRDGQMQLANLFRMQAKGR